MLANAAPALRNLTYFSTCLVALCLVAPRPGVGQRIATPDTGRAQTGPMTEAAMDGILRVLARPESAERLATFTRHYYDALVRKGFSREEALQIVIAAAVFRIPSWAR